MKGQPSISRIYDIGARSTEDDPLETWGRIERLRRNAWHESGLIAVRIKELPPELAAGLKSWAEVQYGKRKA